MNYNEVSENIPMSDFLTACVSLDTTPDVVGKKILNLKEEAMLWDKAHIEYGTLRELNKRSFEQTGNITVEASWEMTKEVRGSNIKTARSSFMKPDDKLIKKWEDCKNQFCKFYVSYTENTQDGSVFRTLLDIEIR